MTYGPDGGDRARPPVRPVDRYGDRPPSLLRRRALLVLLAVGLLALAGAWVYVALSRVDPPVRAELLGFQRTSDTAVDIQFVVDRDPGVAVACVLRARGADGAEVGRAQVLVAADDESRTDVRHTLRTTAPAVTGEVVSCQPYDPPSGLAVRTVAS